MDTISIPIQQHQTMANTYLIVAFKDKDTAKALGARWDSVQRQWFVPEGRELAPFAIWLPGETTSAGGSSSTSTTCEMVAFSAVSTELTEPLKKGVSLSELLGGISQAVAQAYRSGVWTLVEVVELRANNGHVFIGVSERDARGAVLAKTSAVIWQTTANTILPEFERTTGAQLAPGIKLLVRARPVFKALHGFTLEIDAIDSEYTLGDLEARKREIRERLQAEGLFALNKQLPAPWDFNAVLVVAPEGGAGLGDFQMDANQLEKFGICRFTYAYSRFQGDGAAKEICDAIQGALQAWAITSGEQPDAVVIIRGGGAVNDMAWLNDYDLARLVCDLSIPVLTGIGHERDNTVIDEVAHTRFDTPSKVIAGIEQVISKRASEAKANFEQIVNLAAKATQSTNALVSTMDMTVRSEAQRHLAQARQSTQTLQADIQIDSIQTVRTASEQSRDAFQLVKAAASTQLAVAKRDVPVLWDQIALGTKHALQQASAQSDALRVGVIEHAQRDVAQAKQSTEDALDVFGNLARSVVKDGASRTESLIREITGQGPEKTLRRGFAIVRTAGDVPLTRAAQTSGGAAIEIQFSDGRVRATTGEKL
jgi:exodeoxyribonuclease VII large subunit